MEVPGPDTDLPQPLHQSNSVYFSEWLLIRCSARGEQNRAHCWNRLFKYCLSSKVQPMLTQDGSPLLPYFMLRSRSACWASFLRRAPTC